MAKLVGDLVRVGEVRTRLVVNDRPTLRSRAAPAACIFVTIRFPRNRPSIAPVGAFCWGDRCLASPKLKEPVLDYLIAGSVFRRLQTGSGSGAGPGRSREVVQAVDAPVLAIGGMTPERLDEVAAVGAAGAAGIGLFIDWFDRLETPS